MDVAYNKTKLYSFKESGLCPAKYKQLNIDELYKSILNEKVARVSYDMFLYIRWSTEKKRRIDQSSALQASQALEYLIKLKKRQDAMDELKTNAIQKISSKPTLLGGKDYRNLFKDEIDETEWNDIELQIRKMFLSDIEKEKAKGGCSNCARNGLVRKYVKQIQDLLL